MTKSAEGIIWNLRDPGYNSGIPCFVTGVKPYKTECLREVWPDLAGFVKTKKDGQAIVDLFDGFALLDYRESEPDWIQVKVSIDPPYIEALRALEKAVRDNDYMITREIIRRVKLCHSNPSSRSWFNWRSCDSRETPCFVTGAMPDPGKVFKTVCGYVRNPQDGKVIVSMFNGAARISQYKNRPDVTEVHVAAGPEFVDALTILGHDVKDNNFIITPEIIKGAKIQACLGSGILSHGLRR